LLAASVSRADATNHERVQNSIIKIANEVGVDSNLLAALCYQESRFKYFYNMNDGGSPSLGPCQVKKITAKHVGLYRDYMTSEDMIRVGALYLKENIDRCGGIRPALAAYNTGKCIQKPKKGGYVDSVMVYYNLLQSGKTLYKK
jgi:soluble lytic murein transglycosylase-like protein